MNPVAMGKQQFSSSCRVLYSSQFCQCLLRCHIRMFSFCFFILSFCVCMHVDAGPCVEVTTVNLRCCSWEAIYLLFETGSLSGLELADQVRPSEQGTPGVHRSQPPRHWDYQHIATTSGSLKMCVWGLKLRSSCLCIKQALSSAPFFTFC